MSAGTGNRFADLFSQATIRAGKGGTTSPRDAVGLISFYAGYPDPTSLPVDDIIESTRVAIESDGDWALQYGASAGDPALIHELIEKLKRDQGIEANPENILITNGGSQALSLIVNLLVEPGDIVISEAPTWMGAVDNFTAAGADVREIAVDNEGADVAAIERELAGLRDEGKRAKFVYVIPNFQNPSGVTMTLERRNRLLEIAAEYDVPIIEDDAYFDLRYSGASLPTLYQLDSGNRVMYMGTFSKIMAAGMRLGWVVAHEDVISHLIPLKAEGGTSPFASHVATQFIASGTLNEHVQELRALYHSRRDVMLAVLEAHMPPGTTWTMPDGGFFIWVRFPEGVTMEKLSPACRERGVEIAPGHIFYYHGRGANELRLSYSFADEEAIKQGIATLGEIASELIDADETRPANRSTDR
ncbi:MAG: PLP-dependent aminotransferase family protein [Chloroflexota bacterium]